MAEMSLTGGARTHSLRKSVLQMGRAAALFRVLLSDGCRADSLAGGTSQGDHFAMSSFHFVLFTATAYLK